MKHTPGPWAVDNEQMGFPYVVAGEKPDWRAPIICDLYEDVTPEDSVTCGPWLKAYPNAEANARLIAAAPDLLEALHHISLCSQSSASSKEECGRIARAAITKATGGGFMKTLDPVEGL